MGPKKTKGFVREGDLEKAMETIGPLPEPWSRPVLVVLSGLPGSGKSYFGRKLAERVPMAVISTDAIRLALVRHPTYTWQESGRVYEVCHSLIDKLLSQGIPTLFDGTNLIERFRKTVYEIAEKNNAKLIVVETVSPTGVIFERMARRATGEDLMDRSEAGWNVYLKMRDSADSILRDHFTVDTSQPLEPALDQIVQAIRN